MTLQVAPIFLEWNLRFQRYQLEFLMRSYDYDRRATWRKQPRAAVYRGSWGARTGELFRLKSEAKKIEFMESSLDATRTLGAFFWKKDEDPKEIRWNFPI